MRLKETGKKNINAFLGTANIHMWYAHKNDVDTVCGITKRPGNIVLSKERIGITLGTYLQLLSLMYSPF